MNSSDNYKTQKLLGIVKKSYTSVLEESVPQPTLSCKSINPYNF